MYKNYHHPDTQVTKDAERRTPTPTHAHGTD